MGRDRLLYRAVIVLGILLSVSFTFNGLEWRDQKRTDHRLATTNQHVAATNRKLAASIASQLSNRTHNVSVWCGAINATRAYDRRFVKRVTDGRVAYQLADLDCAKLAAATQTSAKATATSLTAIAAPNALCASPSSTMNCVLAGLPAPPSYSISPQEVLGVDYGWGNITPAQATALHLAFVASYLSNDPSKNFTAATVSAFHAKDVKTVDVWESTANRATEGLTAGEQDARAARAQAAALGNTTRPILFAVDCDCTDLSILPYFQGVHAVLGARADAYGGYSQVLFLHSQHLVGNENWQTYAWSEGHWLPGTVAPLEQYLNGTTYDWDRAIATPYGQFPWSAPKPPVRTATSPTVTVPPAPPPTSHAICWGKRATPGSRLCSTVRSRYRWLTGRQRVWRHRFFRCIRYASQLGCSRAWHWTRTRQLQAATLKARYS